MFTVIDRGQILKVRIQTVQLYNPINCTYYYFVAHIVKDSMFTLNQIKPFENGFFSSPQSKTVVHTAVPSLTTVIVRTCTYVYIDIRRKWFRKQTSPRGVIESRFDQNNPMTPF